MDTLKLKLKIGDNEFDAEGPSEIVQAQFAAFQELVAAKAALPKPAHSGSTTPVGGELMLDRIMRLDGRVVSLTARAENLEDEILLVLLGQKVMRQNESVTGAEIIDGLKRTGHVVNRIDYRLDRMSEGTAATVITIGSGRARRYRMTNAGFNKAQTLAMELVQKVA